jgi:hypothetical protein
MRKLLAFVVLLLVCLPGLARAGEKDIVERLKRKGSCCAVVSGSTEIYSGLGLMRGYDDSDLTDLCELRGLRNLRLQGPGFTDAGMRQLEGLKDLKSLQVVGCPNVSPASVERLRKVLPSCELSIRR